MNHLKITDLRVGTKLSYWYQYIADVCDFCGRTKDEARQCYS